jgi:HSP20 family protein
MVSFLQSNAAATTALLASLATTDAAYGRVYYGSRPSTALGQRMLPTLSGRSPFSSHSRDIFDEMFDTMFGGMDGRFYEPLSLQRLISPSYRIQGPSALNALAPSTVKNAFGITQDDKQLQIAVDVPGAKAGDINLQLEEDGRLLKISGETKREEGGISVHSQFSRSFALNRDVDTSKMSAQIDNGVLTITAPKFEEAKEDVRKIDIVEKKKIEGGEEAVQEEEEDVTASHEKEESKKEEPEVDETVIDLDEKKG